MSETATRRTVSASVKVPRDPSLKTTDMAAIRAIAQAAVEVELFTIPLYMTSLYSIQGMHQITSQGSKMYEGRLWPGPKATASPKTANEKAFNIVFSVFIQEMLHLQLAANMAAAIGVTPNFTSSALQTDDHGWTCFGPANSTIPHIIDLKDTIKDKDVIVNIGPLTREQLRLFLAIEQPDTDAREDIEPEAARLKYFAKAPFANWKIGDELPMFGTIGWMYQCYLDYLNVNYTDGSTLWDAIFNPNGQQNDLFNSFGGSGHPMREFMEFETTIALTYKDIAFRQMAGMMDAITDQGEGSVLKVSVNAANLQAVEKKYRPSLDALRSDYPTFTQTGALAPSADAVARHDNDGKDHYERFKELLKPEFDTLETWPDWLAKHGPWKASDLQTPDYAPPADPKIPSTADVAAAINQLADAGLDNFKLLSQAAIGAIAGVTTVLDNYWNAAVQADKPVTFPYPSMSGSGDRMAICWAVFGKAPDLSLGLEPLVAGTLYHSCQALDFDPAAGQAGTNQCAQTTVFHSCRGSNHCQAQGGCGFVQLTTGGGSCGGKLATGTAGDTRTFGANCGRPKDDPYSAPGDNKCGTLGGCAVPISASQLFPKSGKMLLFKFVKNPEGTWTNVPLEEPLFFDVGDNVHDVAWEAYKRVMQLDSAKPAPAPTALRLVFAPST